MELGPDREGRACGLGCWILALGAVVVDALSCAVMRFWWWVDGGGNRKVPRLRMMAMVEAGVTCATTTTWAASAPAGYN